MRIVPLILLVVISSSLISTAMAEQPSIFPDSYGIDTPNFTPVNVTGTPAMGGLVQPTIFKVQDTVVPWELWAFITALGILVLVAGLVGDHGELVLSLVALAFITLSWILSPFIAWITTESAVLTPGVLVVQPVAVMISPFWLPWLMLVVWVISLGFTILALLNFPLKATKAQTGRLG